MKCQNKRENSHSCREKDLFQLLETYIRLCIYFCRIAIKLFNLGKLFNFNLGSYSQISQNMLLEYWLIPVDRTGVTESCSVRPANFI